ncbi:MAG: darcynin family protein [Burkholderiales bacterium]
MRHDPHRHQRTFFMLLKATPQWRALDADAQRAVFDEALMSVFNGYPELRMSRFNAGAFHGRCTHVIVWTLTDGADAWQYEAAVEGLHARPFFAAPLFEIMDVIPGVEDDADELHPIEAFAV